MQTGSTGMEWREQVERSMRRIGLKKDVADRCRWKEGVKKSCKSSGMHPATSNHWGIDRIKLD